MSVETEHSMRKRHIAKVSTGTGRDLASAVRRRRPMKAMKASKAMKGKGSKAPKAKEAHTQSTVDRCKARSTEN